MSMGWNSVKDKFKVYNLKVKNPSNPNDLNAIDKSILHPDVQAWIVNLIIMPTTSTIEGKFLDALENLYNGSNTAAAIIDEAVRSGRTGSTEYFYLLNWAREARAFPNNNSVILDPDYDLVVMNSKGRLIKFPPKNLLIHEMIHAVLALEDRATGVGNFDYSNPDFNFMGPTQAIANILTQEMGFNDFNRISYGSGTLSDVFTRGNWAADISYTEDKIVTGGVIRASDAFDNNISLSSNIFPYINNYTIQFDPSIVSSVSKKFNNRNLLAIGDERVDIITGNVGNDYIYGAKGDDTFYASGRILTEESV